MIEIDHTFISLSEWMAWAEQNAFVYDAASADKFAQRILANGFVEPLTGRIVLPAEIEANGTNWREGICAHGLNSRVRAVLALIKEKVADINPYEARIFASEGVTALALLLRGIYPRFLGSEYGLDEKARSDLYPIQHEDLTQLTLPSDSFDVVTTNEVLEHVPDIDAALAEIARVLKPGGWHVGTHPFWFVSDSSDLRARIIDGTVVHLKEPEYHGNPVDPDGGSLVFETPGWDIVRRARDAGFRNPQMRFVASERHGYMTTNTGVFVFCAQK